MAIKPVSGEIKSQDINDNLSYLDNKLSQVNGGPLGSLESLAELNQKYPNGANGFFIIDGHMYFWEGNRWVDKGVYQAKDIAKNSITREKIKDNHISINKLNLSNRYLSSFDTEKGFIDVSNGDNIDSTNRIRLSTKAKAKMYDELILLDSDYKYNVFLYNLDGSFISSKGVWETGTYEFNRDCLFNIGLGKVDDSAISNEILKIDNVLKLSNDKSVVIKRGSLIGADVIDSGHIKEKSVNVKNINFDSNSFFSDAICKLGNINVGNGEETLPAYKKIINTPKIKAKKNDKLTLKDERFVYNVFLYDLEGKFITSKGVWETADYTFDRDCLFRLTIKLKNNSFEINEYLYRLSTIFDFSGSKYPFITKQDQLADNIIEKKHLNFEVSGVTSHLSEKRLATLGDSITARGWYQELLQALLNINIANFGVGGSTITKIEGYQVKSFVERMTELPDEDELDYLLIWGGINDFGGLNAFGSGVGVPLGTFDSRDPYTFYGALHTIFEYIIPKYKNKGLRIGFIITTPIAKKLGMYEKNAKGFYLKDYCNAVREVCEFYSIPYLDFYKESGINELNIDVMTSNFAETESDGLHPSRMFFDMRKHKIITFLESL